MGISCALRLHTAMSNLHLLNFTSHEILHNEEEWWNEQQEPRWFVFFLLDRSA
jgi:hypothetical protein